ncbi:hypothetical protein ACMDCR_16280 [Labrys okinawensis]|uniref:hypothetical protein n=1 Tax=Labrys okinawensis TaxID=346911 RepID=UPI0039BC501E
MHPEFAETTDGRKIFYWNLDGAVGLNGKNNFDDVLFVQWCMYKASKWPGIDHLTQIENFDTKGVSFRDAFAKVNINGRCSGLKDDPLLDQINLLQALTQGPMDGRVTPIHGSARYTGLFGIRYVYLVIWLNNILKQVHPKEYPRLDLMPEFAFQLGPQVKPVFWED